MTTRPVCVPLSSSRSTNSPWASASESSKVGCGTWESDKFVARAEPLPASRAHANDVVRTLLAHLANRVQPILRVVALDPNLVSTFTPNRRELHGIGGAM